MNRQFLRDHWSVIRASLKQIFPHLTDNDLAYIAGQEEEVFTRVEIRTGVRRAEVEEALWRAIKPA